MLITDNSSIDLSLTNIWRTWRAFRAGKKPSRAILSYEVNLEHNLIQLCLSLNDGSYQHQGYDHKILSDKKRRDISVASVADRVVHRLLYDYLVPLVDRRFDPDVWSGRKNKGLHSALLRIGQFADKYAHCYAWRADIIKFFDNVDHTVLQACIARLVRDAKTRNLLDKIVSSYQTQLEVSQSVVASPLGI